MTAIDMSSIALTHTPYDGSATPFTIGLKPLDPAKWLEVDDLYASYLAEKDRLIVERPGDVFAAEPDTLNAQREVLARVRQCMGEAMKAAPWGDLYRERESRIFEDADEPPLQAAARLVQEDLVIMRKGEDGWRLAAASLCFPSSWSLAEKFGRPLVDIHEPVPQFGRGTRFAELIERMFDRLQGQMVERYNWSLQANPDLYHPLSNVQRDGRSTARTFQFPGDDPAASAFIRVERQTLCKLPDSGDILFTIRIHLDPMRKLREHPDRARLAASFATQLAALDASQLDYKGLTADRDRLVAVLNAMAEE